MRISDWSSDVCSSDLYTYFRDRGSHVGANIQPFTTGTTIVDGSVKISDRCILTRVRNNNGNNPVIQPDAQGHETLTPHPEEPLFEPDSIPFADLISNQTQQARDPNQTTKQVADGVPYHSGGLPAVLDAAHPPPHPPTP